MKDYEIKEGDIVEIEYIDEFTKERINEGKALVMWKGFNYQPLIHKLDAKRTIWSGYDRIARVVGHVDIERYMEDAMAQEHELCEDCVSRKEALKEMQRYHDDCAKTSEYTRLGFETAMNVVRDLPSVTPQPKTGHWIDDKCSVCGKGAEDLISSREWYRNEEPKFCPFCGIKLVESQVGDEE